MRRAWGPPDSGYHGHDAAVFFRHEKLAEILRPTATYIGSQTDLTARPPIPANPVFSAERTRSTLGLFGLGACWEQNADRPRLREVFWITVGHRHEDPARSVKRQAPMGDREIVNRNDVSSLPSKTRQVLPNGRVDLLHL